MHFDALTLACLTDELRTRVLDGRVQQVLMVDDDRVGMEIYAARARHYLLLSADRMAAYAYLGDQKLRRGTDAQPPLLLLLRKYVRGARLAAIEQPDPTERALYLHFENPETGACRLIFEPMGRMANLILTTPNERILDCLHRVRAGTAKRALMPGQPYTPPPPVDKLPPLDDGRPSYYDDLGVVTEADGKLWRASAEENADLYWGVRGGGGNFGIVTSFEFQLHPMQRNVVGGDIVFPLSQLRNVLSFYADYAISAPDDLYLDFVVMSKQGTTDGVVILHACYSGPEDQAEKVLGPIRKAGTPINDGIKVTDYVAIQRSWDNSDPRHTGEYLKSGFVNELSDKLVDTIVHSYQAMPERGTSLFFQHSGGAIGRVPTNATAFAHRKSQANMFATVEWPLAEAQDEHVAYIRNWWKNLEPHTDGWYANDVSNESAKHIHKNYQGNYERLVQVKNKYDPTNLFRLNANIKPTV